MSAAPVEATTPAPVAIPAYATSPTPGARNELKQIKIIAQALGTPLMPWQETVARVASERRADDPRRYRYPVVVLTVPRQSGKTTLMRAVLTQRAMMNPGRVAFYTAQTGKDAAARWNDLVKQIERGPFASHVRKRMAAGSQSLTFPGDSTISPFPPTAKSLHGYTPHDVMLDEIFAWDAAQGEDLMGAIKPAQITLPDRQIWLVSTMGTKESEFLHAWVDQGRQAVDDPGASVAYFEWSAPDGADYYDPKTWEFHPALGHTITVDDLAEAAESHSSGEWQRAYMNRRSATSEAFVDMAAYDGAAAYDGTEAAQLPPVWADVMVAYEADPQRRWGAIVAAWMEDGTPQVRVVMAAPGIDWMAREVARIYVEDRPAGIWADDAGASRAITDQLAMLHNTRNGANGVPVSTLATRDYATACGDFKETIDAGKWCHAGSASMREAIENVTTRPLGESWAISRAKSSGPVCEAVAAAVALRAVRQNRKAEKPFIWTGN